MALAPKHYNLFLQLKKNIPDLIEKIILLSNSEIVHKAPPRLITKATEMSQTGPKKPNNKIREQQPSWYMVIPKSDIWKHDNMDDIATDKNVML